MRSHGRRLFQRGTLSGCCLPIDPANGLQIRYNHRDQFCRFQHLALGPPVHDPALDQAEVIDVEPENQGAVGLGFEDLAGMPVLLADDSGIGLGEPERDLEISVAPDRAEAFRHELLGPEVGRAAETLARLLHRTHSLDLEQPDGVSQVAMANQAPVLLKFWILEFGMRNGGGWQILRRKGAPMFRQAGLEPLAMSAFGRESMVYGPAAASEGKRMDFSGGIARVVSYSNGGTARCDRAPFGLSQFGCACQAGASGQGSAHDLTPLAGHGAKEQWPVKTEWRVASGE